MAYTQTTWLRPMKVDNGKLMAKENKQVTPDGAKCHIGRQECRVRKNR